jgi:hypothetical protein
MSRVHIPSELRRLVVARAKDYCEYCLLPQNAAILSHQVDHIIPLKHGGLTASENLALSCVECNRHKGSDFATIDSMSSEVALLFNPRQQSWTEHFRLEEALIIAISQTGRATVTLLQMNHPERVLERSALIEAGIYPPAI